MPAWRAVSTCGVMPIMDAALVALIDFAFVMSITPGPNNVMLANSGANFGIRATMPHILGIVFGFSAMVVLVSAGLGSVLLAWPLLVPVMRWTGAAWMLWLGWKIATAPPVGSAAPRSVLGFAGAAAFQWINPKAWLIALGAASEFTRPDMPLGVQLVRIGVVFFLVALPCMLVWVLLGRGAARLLQTPTQVRVFNVVMALLLVASLVPVLTGAE
jgi:threonine/homoserine/homoserine lactone efflux protein